MKKSYKKESEQMLKKYPECKRFHIKLKGSAQNQPYFEVMNALFDREVERVKISQTSKLL